MSFPVRFLIWLIKGYQRWNSLYGQPCCRFHPNCSEYAVDALKIHGLSGSILIIQRLLRCQPFCAGGVDPVPKSLFSFLKS